MGDLPFSLGGGEGEEERGGRSDGLGAKMGEAAVDLVMGRASVDVRAMACSNSWRRPRRFGLCTGALCTVICAYFLRFSHRQTYLLYFPPVSKFRRSPPPLDFLLLIEKHDILTPLRFSPPPAAFAALRPMSRTRSICRAGCFEILGKWSFSFPSARPFSQIICVQSERCWTTNLLLPSLDT